MTSFFFFFYKLDFNDDHGHPQRSGDVSPVRGYPSSSHTPSFSVENDVVEFLEVENASTRVFPRLLLFHTAIHD